jgi:hypothetical protein
VKKGIQDWYLNGRLHRTDGPAITRFDNTRVYDQEWYLNGQRHRLDGPAVVRMDSPLEWWVNHHQMTEEEHTRLYRRSHTPY